MILMSRSTISIWQRDGGVYIEIELIGLSRSIPWAFRWWIQPLAERLPRNILRVTTSNTRDAVIRQVGAANSTTAPVTH